MTFIEAFLHLSPDGGSGVTETIVMLVLVGASLLALAVRSVRDSSKSL